MFVLSARSFVYGFVCLLALSSLIMFVRSLVRSFVVRSFAASLFLTFVRDVACCVLMFVWLCLDMSGETFPNLATTCYVMW